MFRPLFYVLLLLMRLSLATASDDDEYSGKDPFALGEQIFARAQAEDKLIFLFIGSDVCLESRQFLKDVVQDPEYVDILRNRVVLALLDYDLNPSLSLRYSIPTIPGFFVMDWEGRVYLGATKPDKQGVLPLLKNVLNGYQQDRAGLQKALLDFQKQSESSLKFDSVQEILDSTMNYPNHISLDLGRYILSLPRSDRHFVDYEDQLLQWIRSENFDFVDGSFFMPRGFSTWFAESKYAFFNFRLMEMLADFFFKTGNPEFKHALLKSLRVMKKDLLLDTGDSFSTGYASKNYFKLELKERLKYFPPAPRRFDLALSQIIYLKLLYKLQVLINRGLVFNSEVSFLADDLKAESRQSRFGSILGRYGREDGLIYFTPAKEFASFETQIEYFALLQLVYQLESVDQKVLLSRMETLFSSFVDAFFDKEAGMFCDAPLQTIAENPRSYQYPLYFVREHARLLQFLDFLRLKTGKEKYREWHRGLMTRIEAHNRKYPQRFYWLDWYKNLRSTRLGEPEGQETEKPDANRVD